MSALHGSRRRFLAGSAGLATFGIVRTVARAAQYEIKCASNQAVDYPGSIRLGQMWAAIERESGGRIHPQFYPNSLLGGDAAMFSQMRLGAIHFYLIGSGQLAEVVPPADIGYLGFAYRDADEGTRVMDGPLGEYIRRESAAKGIYVLRNIWDNGMYNIGSSTRAIRVPDDLRGYKIRVSESKILVDLFSALGANVSPLSSNEVYTAMQTKLVDGTASAPTVIDAHRWYEVMKYMSMTAHEWGGAWLIANGEFYKSLPSDLKDIIERNAAKYVRLERQDVKTGEAAVVAKIASRGIAINKVDPAPFRARLKPYYETWAKQFGPTEWGLLQSGLGHSLI